MREGVAIFCVISIFVFVLWYPLYASCVPWCVASFPIVNNIFLLTCQK